MNEPTNADLKKTIETQGKQLEEHAKSDAAFQDNTANFEREMGLFQAETEGTLAELHGKIDNLATKDDLEDLVEKIIQKIIQKVGKRSYAGLLIAAGIVGALVVIGGGAKSLLGWLGFNILRN